MKKFLSVLWRRPRPGPSHDEPDLLFDEAGIGREAEPVPELSAPRWGRSMVLPAVVLLSVLAMVYLQQRAESQRAAGVARGR